jgi:hypothetical protein
MIDWAHAMGKGKSYDFSALKGARARALTDSERMSRMKKLDILLEACRDYVSLMILDITKKSLPPEELKERIVCLQQQVSEIYAHPDAKAHPDFIKKCDKTRELLQNTYMVLGPSNTTRLIRKWCAKKFEEIAKELQNMRAELH